MLMDVLIFVRLNWDMNVRLLVIEISVMRFVGMGLEFLRLRLVMIIILMRKMDVMKIVKSS